MAARNYALNGEILLYGGFGRFLIHYLSRWCQARKSFNQILGMPLYWIIILFFGCELQ